MADILGSKNHRLCELLPQTINRPEHTAQGICTNVLRGSFLQYDGLSARLRELSHESYGLDDFVKAFFDTHGFGGSHPEAGGHPRRLQDAPFAGHTLRASFATQAARNGVTAFDIMRQTGHRSIATVSALHPRGPDFPEAAC